ncbi:MAG TPA: hypothetical protein VNW04_09330 [Puia sp.]|nr:hypothetical protein [Puia sp.]
MRPLRPYFALVLFWLPAMLLHAQRKPAPPPAIVKATIDKDSILIGQPIQLMLEATVPDNIPFTWPAVDSLPHFEWLEKGKPDTSVRPGQRYYRQYFTITSFDSGRWTIPRLTFLAGTKKVMTDSIRITIGYSKIDPAKDFHDIKDIIDIPNPWARWIPWIIGAVTGLSLILVFWLVSKRKIIKRLITRQMPRLSPLEEAMQHLDELAKQQLSLNGAIKVYYTRLDEIFRVYLFRRMGISSLAETSEELITQLRSSPLQPTQFDSLAETLRMSDFVKFAKYQPGITESDHHYHVIRTSILALEPPPQNPQTTK